jgi:lipoate-protein ligase A
LPPLHELFGVEAFRTEPQRMALVREVTRPTLVLGSTQPAEIVDPQAVREGAVDLARRRGGGGAVYLAPGRQLWLDAWIPRDDSLWVADVSVAAEWVGAWWMDALVGPGPHGVGARGLDVHRLEVHRLDVHRGRSLPGAFGDLVCFAGRGPGEVFHRGRKLVGLTQWRSREGALFSSCAYLDWDPVPLLETLQMDEPARMQLRRELTPIALGLNELEPPVGDLAAVRDQLLGSFPSLGVRSS